jgi:protein-tyrosine phosphatase
MAEHQTLAIDASNVYPRIWVGAAPPADRHLSHFTLIVLCAREYQPERPAWTARVARARLPDEALSRPELREAVVAARAVVEEARRGGRVLVTCAQGINRSALVAGMAILQLTPRMSADEVIRTMKARRHPNCLYNHHFQAILQRLRPSPITSPGS